MYQWTYFEYRNFDELVTVIVSFDTNMRTMRAHLKISKKCASKLPDLAGFQNETKIALQNEESVRLI